ncbi:unnamed protein product, partial [Symbiodinium microadriaticum]
EEADSLHETQQKEEADSLHETEKKDPPLSLVKVEVVDLEASTAGTPRGRADVPAKAKLGMMAELDRLAIEKASKRQARLQLMKQYGVSETFCWNLQGSAKRQKVSNFVAKAAETARQPDHLKSVWHETRAWALSEEARQHILTAGDVLLDFEDRLEAAIALRQAEETAGTLDKTGQVELAAMRQKRDTLTKNKRQRDKYQVKLLAKCGLRSRACQQTANLSAEEEKARLETAWRLWDSLLQQAASPEPDKSFPVSDIEDWARHRRETAITMSDQIPAWLKPSPGKVVTKVLRLKLAREQSKLRAAARKKGSTAKAKAEARQAAGPRLRSATRAPGVAARWRVSLVARQAVRHYFNADRQPLGAVMPTILVVYGKHCRLENISQAGTWIKSEKFQIGSKLVNRKAGKPVPGSLMRSWRKLRATQPELFSIRVWSQPAAVVDSVIYRWQLEMEAEEHRQVVQLVDMFAAAWTEDSMHAAALLQRAQTGIAAGCTGLTQVTDTGFGQPAKAALARWQEELKQRMQKVHCTYQTGPQDILQAARQMHARTVEINETDSTILRCMRQAGSQYLQDRSRWVEAGRVLPFSEEERKAVQAGSHFETEASYLLSQEGLQTGFALDLKPGAKLLAETERELRQVMLQQLHPSQRRQLFDRQVANTTSQEKPEKREQKRKKLKNSKKDRVRRKLLQKWREKQGSKTAQKELLSVVPTLGKTDKKKAKKRKKTDSKKPNAADKPSSKKHEAHKKKRERQQRAVDRQEAFADAAVQGALFGKTARVIRDMAPASLRGLEVVCRKQTDSHVLVQQRDRQEWVEQADISLDVGVRLFPLQLDIESFPAVAAREEAAALGDLQLYSFGDLLTDSQLLAGIRVSREMSYRLSAGSQPDSLCLLLPAEAKLLLRQGAAGLKAETASLLQDRERASLHITVVQSQPPRHWSLLVLEKPRGSQTVSKVRYYDTLPGPASYKEASGILKVLLQAARQEQQPLPAPVSKLRQSDGFSCGLWVLLYLEQEWRRWLAEPPQALPTDIQVRSSQLNRWLQCLLRTRELARLERQTDSSVSERREAEQKIDSSATPESQPAQHKADSTAPEEPPPMPPPAGPPPETDSDELDKTFGCEKCGFVLAGCMLCSPKLYAKYSQSQTVKAKAKPKAKAKAEPKAAKAKAKSKSKP